MRPYKQPDPVQLAEAVSLVRNGLLSLRQAGQRFGIPKSTLYDHLHGKVESGSRPGRRPMLPSHLEDALADQCMEAAKKGMGVSRQQLAIKTARILNRIRVTTSTAIPGKKWLSGFRSRHPELSLRKPQKLSAVRAQRMDRDTTAKYFEASTIIKKTNLFKVPSLGIVFSVRQVDY